MPDKAARLRENRVGQIRFNTLCGPPIPNLKAAIGIVGCRALHAPKKIPFGHSPTDAILPFSKIQDIPPEPPIGST